MADKVNVITIVGSLRKGSFNAALQRALPSLAPAGLSIKPTTASFAGLAVYNFEDHQATGIPAAVNVFVEQIRAADGLIIVSPEYNWSIPGGLKNLIDWISRLKDQPFEGKAVALQSCATGPLGGARMQYHLRQAMVFLNAHTFNTPEIFVGMAQTKFDEKTMDFKDEAGIKFITQQLAAFEGYVRKLTGK